MRFGLPLTFLLATLAAAGVARAEPREVVVVARYTAPEECPTREAFEAQVQSKIPPTFDGSTASLPTFTVSVFVGSESTGRLTIVSADGIETTRAVAGDSCGEVVSALALIAAIAIDPKAATEGANPPAPSEKDTPHLITTETPKPEPARPAPSSDTMADEKKAPEPPKRGWRVAAAVDAALSTGVVPGALFSTPISLAVLAPRALLSPTAHLGFVRTTSGTAETSNPGATFTWTSAFLDACPHRWVLGALELEPCARFEGGILTATGTNVIPARQDTRGWLAVGGLGRAEWTFLAPLFAQVEVGFHAPINRTTYFFRPDSEYFRVPALGAMGAAGVGARFP